MKCKTIMTHHLFIFHFIYLCSMPAPFHRTGRFRRDARDLDEEEESWFNDDDDDKVDCALSKHVKLVDPRQLMPLKDINPLSPVKDRPLSPPLLSPGSPLLGSPPLGSPRKEFRSLSPISKDRPQSPPLIRPSLKPHTSAIKIKVVSYLSGSFCI